MGGHAAWRKRVAEGGLAKGSGGAIARHRPRLGRKGEDLKLNRKGNIAGGNPKKRKVPKSPTVPTGSDEVLETGMNQKLNWTIFGVAGVLFWLLVSLTTYLYAR